MNGTLAEFISDSTAVFKIYLANSLTDTPLEPTNGHSEHLLPPFNPKYTYQIFGDEESIFGYKDLRISLFLSPAGLEPFLRLQFSEKVDFTKYGVKPDEIIEKINEFLPVSPLLKPDEFSVKLSQEDGFCPHGTLYLKYALGERTFEQYTSSCYDKGFLAYQDKIQNLMMLYIEGASQLVLESEDDFDRWLYYVIYEKSKSPDGTTKYTFVGCLNAYKFYSFPDKFRIRISQVLVLPPFQNQGHATRLFETFSLEMAGDETVFDTVVEDPTEEFTRLRDFVDCKNAIKLSCFQKDNIKQNFNKEMEQECREKLKLHRKQSRRVHEILRLKHTNLLDLQECKDYRLFIKQRLNAPYMRLLRNHEHARVRIPKGNSDFGLCLDVLIPPKDRQENLQKEYQALEEEYQLIIAKLFKFE